MRPLNGIKKLAENDAVMCQTLNLATYPVRCQNVFKYKHRPWEFKIISIFDKMHEGIGRFSIK